MKFSIFQDSRIGKRRSNQDRLAHCYSRESLLLVVADGMGGHPRGEVAAQIAVRTLTETFERESLPRLPDPYLFLSWSFEQAHREIVAYAVANDMAEVPRTTCVACVVQDSIAYWAHVGDSRLYVLRDGHVHVRTRDHSRVQMMVDQGLLSEEDARLHSERNLVYNCLGGDQPPQTEFSRKTTLAVGDIILLCSDGVWGPLDDAALVSGFNRDSVATGGAQTLDLAEARTGASCDNLSLIAVGWEENYAADDSVDVETLTMPIDSHTTVMMAGGESMRQPETLNEEEIDRAIEEIRAAIKRNSR